MTAFRDWLSIERIGEEVYLEALIRLEAEKSLADLLEFYNMAVSCQIRVDEDNETEDEDGGPVELDDPFSGDEDAAPVEETPDDSEPEQNSGEVESEEDKAASDAKKDARRARAAKEIQDLAWAVRWSAMLDRRDSVAELKRIYESEWLPIVKDMERGVSEAFRNAVEFEGMSEGEAKKRVCESMGVSLYEASKMIMRGELSRSRINESDWGIPKLKDKKAAMTLEERVKAVMSKAKPILVRLGYAEQGDLEGSSQQNRLDFEKAMKAATAEQGNEPPKNKVTEELSRSPAARARQREMLQLALYKMLMKPAMRVDRADSRSVVDADTGKSKLASKYSQGPEDIVSGAMVVILSKLTKRRVRKSDMEVAPWTTDLSVLTADAADNPGKIINSIKSVVTRRTMYRDEDRGSKKAAGVRTNSKDGVTYLGGSGGKRDDGTMGDMDPTDMRTRDSLTASAQRETGGTMIEAFKQAMKELKDKRPSEAILACLWMSLDCGADGNIPTANIHRLISAAGGAAMSSRKTPAQFIASLGLDQILPGKFRGRGGAGEWELVKLIKAKGVPTTGRLGGMPIGNMPEQAPNYANRMSLTPADKAWYDYMKKVNDARLDGLRFVMDRMAQIMAENDESQKPKGWESPCSWNIVKFLNETFHDEIGSGGVRVEGRAPTINVTFYNKNKKGKEIRFYTITIQGQKINIVQKGWEQDVFSYDLPVYNKPCPECHGRGGNCPSCEGCGSTMDRARTLELERSIHLRLLTQRRRAKPKS